MGKLREQDMYVASVRGLSPPFGSSDPQLLRVLQATALADDLFDMELMEAFPAPADSGRELHEKYIPSLQVRFIASLLFMLSSLDMRDGAALLGVIKAHNARMQAMLTDWEQLKRWGLRSQRFKRAIFSKGAAENAAANVTLLRRLALDGTTFSRLLAPQANRTSVFEALDVLKVAGAFAVVDGAYDSKVYISVGKLEAIYSQFLARLRDGIVSATHESA